MDIKQLEYFIACAETGSVSEAAKILYSTQSSVSKVIKTLENSSRESGCSNGFPEGFD